MQSTSNVFPITRKAKLLHPVQHWVQGRETYRVLFGILNTCVVHKMGNLIPTFPKHWKDEKQDKVRLDFPTQQSQVNHLLQLRKQYLYKSNRVVVQLKRVFVPNNGAKNKVRSDRAFPTQGGSGTQAGQVGQVTLWSRSGHHHLLWLRWPTIFAHRLN